MLRRRVQPRMVDEESIPLSWFSQLRADQPTCGGNVMTHASERCGAPRRARVDGQFVV